MVAAITEGDYARLGTILERKSQTPGGVGDKDITPSNGVFDSYISRFMNVQGRMSGVDAQNSDSSVNSLLFTGLQLGIALKKEELEMELERRNLSSS
jgi:hypothetical protein